MSGTPHSSDELQARAGYRPRSIHIDVCCLTCRHSYVRSAVYIADIAWVHYEACSRHPGMAIVPNGVCAGGWEQRPADQPSALTRIGMS